MADQPTFTGGGHTIRLTPNPPADDDHDLTEDEQTGLIDLVIPGIAGLLLVLAVVLLWVVRIAGMI